MATSNPTPWERRSSVGPCGQPTLPSIGQLAGGVNGASPVSDSRDSGNWSLASSSQRTSNISDISSVPLQLPPIDASRNSPGEPHHFSTQSPISGGFGASTTSLHSTHTTPPGHYGPPNGDLPTPSPSASRRSSFDTRLGSLQLSSPVNGTPAASQVSLNSTLLNSGNRDSLTSQMQRDRGIQSNSPHPPPLHGHDGPQPPHNPFAFRSDPATSRPGVPPTRTAPPIVGSSRYPYGQSSHPNAPSPTKGLPWAFPDPDFDPANRNSDPVNGRTSATSLPGSAASSLYGNSGIVSPHQSHQMPPMMGLNGHIHGQTLPQITATHHHTLSTRRPSIISEGTPQSTPYSRTPELRVSHKLAERKRRKEMKELFDELRDALPAERGGKSSKWEVLTKAIEFVNHQKESIVDKTRTIEKMEMDLQRMQKENEALRNDIHNYRQMSHQQQGPPPPSNYHPQNYHQSNGNDGGYHSQPSHPVKMQGLEQC